MFAPVRQDLSPPAPAPSTERPRWPLNRRHAADLLRLTRPRQWVKNLLVLAAPMAAGSLFAPEVLGPTMAALAAMTMAASGTYALNDVADRHADASHPEKRHRPVAAGAVDPGTAVRLGLGLLAASLLLPLAAGVPAVAGVVAVYVSLTTVYSRWLPHVPLFDITAVSAGFLLRAIAGAVGPGLPMSRWFLVVVGFGSLYVVAHKRSAEHRALTRGDVTTRRSLVAYSSELLREIRFTAGALTIAGYVSWAFDQRDALGGDPWATLSIVPFVLGVFRYSAVVEAGLGEAPEEILLRDRVLQAIGLAWLLLFLGAVHVG